MMSLRDRYSSDEYGAQRQEAFRQRYLIGFTGLLFRAHDGDAGRLCDYLLSDEPLSADDREGLAWLIDKKLQAKPRGRRTGRVRSAFLDAAHEIVCRVRERRESERAGRKRLPKGRLNQLIAEEIAAYEERHPEDKCKFSVDYIRSALDR